MGLLVMIGQLLCLTQGLWKQRGRWKALEELKIKTRMWCKRSWIICLSSLSWSHEVICRCHQCHCGVSALWWCHMGCPVVPSWPSCAGFSLMPALQPHPQMCFSLGVQAWPWHLLFRCLVVHLVVATSWAAWLAISYYLKCPLPLTVLCSSAQCLLSPAITS